MVVGKVTLGRASAVENLFDKYICDSKHEGKTLKKRKRAKELNQSNIGGLIKKKEKKLKRRDKFGKDLTESIVQSTKQKHRIKNSKKRRNGSPLEDTPKAFKTFDNPIGRIAELLFSPRVKSEHFVNTNDKDKLCHLISSLFNTSEKNDSQFEPRHKIIIKDTKSLTVVKDKLLKGSRKQIRIDTKTEHVSRKKHRKHKSEKHDRKIDINKQKLDVLKLFNVECEHEIKDNVNYRSRGITKFSYQNANEILTELIDKSVDKGEIENEQLKQERMYELGRGDGKLSLGYLTYMKCEADEGKLTSYVSNEEIMKQVQNLGNMLQFSSSQISYVVQFSNGTSPEEPGTRRKTFSNLLEESHFGGKALDIRKSRKDILHDIVNQPVEDQEFWKSGAKLSRVTAVDVIENKEIEKNKDDIEVEKVECLEPSTILIKDNEPELATVPKKKKPNKCMRIIRTCLCLGKPKSLSEIPDKKSPTRKHVTASKSDRKQARPNVQWGAPVNQLYMVANDSSTGGLQKPKKRPSLKVRTAKVRNRKRVKSGKSSKVTCCIEWKGNREGEIFIGKRKKQCLQFKIAKWAQTDVAKDGGKSYTLEAFLLPNE